MSAVSITCLHCIKRCRLIFGALVLSACSHTPSLKLFAPPSQNGFVNAPQDAGRAEPVGDFWRGFEDPLLNKLVGQALEANPDVRTAAANLREARAFSRIAEANLLPTADLGVSAARVRSQDDRGVPGTRSNYNAGLDLLWEVDLFGGLADARRAAVASVQASAEGVRAARVSVVAETVRNYFELRGLQQQLRVARASLDTQQQVLQLVEARLDAGRGTALDTERARALFQSTAANVPALESASIRTRHHIAVLCGLTPTTLDAELSDEQPLPGLKAVTLANIGSPASLLRRRPDILAVEAQAAAAAAQAGVARSALFPRVSLGGTLGQNASQLSALGDGASYVYNLGAQITWNLLDFGRIRAQVAAADARTAAAMIAYERAVLAALEETEGALAAYTRSQRQAELLFDAARASEQAALIARERFAAGSTDFLTVLDAERELLVARDRLAQSQSGAAVSLVSVYKALGGDWTVPSTAQAN
jgi:multidrug efflux system outer membrane protein